MISSLISTNVFFYIIALTKDGAIFQTTVEIKNIIQTSVAYILALNSTDVSAFPLGGVLNAQEQETGLIFREKHMEK